MCTERALWEALLDPGGAEGALRGQEAAKIESDTGCPQGVDNITGKRHRKAHQETEGRDCAEKLHFKAGKPAWRKWHLNWVSNPM